MLARKFVSYRLHMAGITQNKLKYLVFIVVPQGRKCYYPEGFSFLILRILELFTRKFCIFLKN